MIQFPEIKDGGNTALHALVPAGIKGYNSSLYATTRCVFICEHGSTYSTQTLYAIASERPFIVVGKSPGILEHLRRDGYLTFRTCIDESYDAEEDVDERVRLALIEVAKISRMGPRSLDKFTQRNHGISIKNRTLLRRLPDVGSLLVR
jgi:hypothetical protein